MHFRQPVGADNRVIAADLELRRAIRLLEIQGGGQSSGSWQLTCTDYLGWTSAWCFWYASRVTDERNDTGGLTVRLVCADEVAWYNALMKEHHLLGVAASGRVLRYVAEAGGVPAVLGTFGSAAWRLPVRDQHVGWDDGQRAARLERVCANQRLCVLPGAAVVRHAGSRALGAMLRALPGDYLAAFGVRLMAVESFTHPVSHAGTV